MLLKITKNTLVKERKLMTSGRKLTLIAGGVRRKGGKTEIVDPYQANRAHADKIKAITPKNKLDIYKSSLTGQIKAGIDKSKSSSTATEVDSTELAQINKKIQDNKQKNKDGKLEFFIKQYGKQIPEAEISQIYDTLKTSADGKVSNTTNWVLRKYKDLKGEVKNRFIKEDLPSTVVDALLLHSKFNNKIRKAPLRKLDDVESFDQLYDITSGLKELKTNKEDIADIKENQTTVLHSDDNGEVLIPKTEEASKYYGSAAYKNVNTRWCTAADNDNMFNFYTKERHPNSELFIITYKGKNGELRKAQYHPESKQFKDEKDAELTREEQHYIADNNPDAIKAIVEHRVKNGKSISDIASIDSHFFERPENVHYKAKAIKDIHKDSDINQFLKTGKGAPFEDDLRKFTDEIVKVDKDYFKNNPREQKMLGDVAKKGIETGIEALGRYGEYSTLINNLKTYKNLGLATPEVTGIVNNNVYKVADEALTGEDANIRVGSQILKVATALNPNHFKDNPDIQEKYLKMIEANITEESYGVAYSSVVFDAANALDKNIEHPITKGMFQKQTNLVNSDFKKLNKMNSGFSREEMLRRVENGNIDDASMIGVTNIYDAFKNDTGSMDKSAQPVLDNLNKARKENEKDGNDKPNTYTLDGLKVHKTSVEHLLSNDETANMAYKVIPDPDENGDADVTSLLSDDNWGLLKQHVEDSGGGNIPLAKLKYTMALKGEIVDGKSETISAEDINDKVRTVLVDRFDAMGDKIASKNPITILEEVLGGTADKKGYITVPYTKLEAAIDPDYEDFASGFEDSDLDSSVLPISKYNFGDKAGKAIGKQVKSTFKPNDEFNAAVKDNIIKFLKSKTEKSGVYEKTINDTNHIEERKIALGRKRVPIAGSTRTKGGKIVIVDPFQANRAVNPNKKVRINHKIKTVNPNKQTPKYDVNTQQHKSLKETNIPYNMDSKTIIRNYINKHNPEYKSIVELTKWDDIIKNTDKIQTQITDFVKAYNSAYKETFPVNIKIDSIKDSNGIDAAGKYLNGVMTLSHETAFNMIKTLHDVAFKRTKLSDMKGIKTFIHESIHSKQGTIHGASTKDIETVESITTLQELVDIDKFIKNIGAIHNKQETDIDIVSKSGYSENILKFKNMMEKLTGRKYEDIQNDIKDMSYNNPIKDYDKKLHEIGERYNPTLIKSENSPLSSKRLKNENIVHATTGGTSQAGSKNKLIQQAGFRDSETGKIYPTGAVHNPENLPNEVITGHDEDGFPEWKASLVSGFIDNGGKFITRDELAKRQKVGVDPSIKPVIREVNEIKKAAIKAKIKLDSSKLKLKKQKDTIISEAKKNGTYLKAPNGKDTKLTPEQWATVRTKEFKDWFGDWENDPNNSSKVIDENGEPAIVYHGTDSPDDFKKFNTPSYFTTHPDEASGYTNANQIGMASKLRKKYKEVKGAKKHDGETVPYIGIIDDIPKINTIYATDNGIARIKKNKTIEIFSDLVTDDTSYNSNYGTIKLKAGKSDEYQKHRQEIEDYIKANYSKGTHGRIYPVFLNIRSPKEVSAMTGNVLGARLKLPNEKNKLLTEIANGGHDGISTYSDTAAFFPDAQVALSGIPKQYIPLHPKQIKLALTNKVYEKTINNHVEERKVPHGRQTVPIKGFTRTNKKSGKVEIVSPTIAKRPKADSKNPKHIKKDGVLHDDAPNHDYAIHQITNKGNPATHGKFIAVDKKGDVIKWFDTEQESKSYDPNKIEGELISQHNAPYQEVPEFNNHGEKLADGVHPDKPETWGISKKDMDDVLNRVFNKQREYFDTTKEWLDSKKDFLEGDYLSDTLDCEYDLSVKYIRHLPEGTGWSDILDAYKDGKLPLEVKKPEGTKAIDIPKDVKANPFDNLGEPRQNKALTKDALLERWKSAITKQTKGNKQEVQNARTDLFLEYMSNPDMAKTMEMSQSDIQRKIKSWSNMSVNDRLYQQKLNTGVSDVNQWVGITNLNYLSQQRLSINDMDGFVKNINAPSKTGWVGHEGDMLRRHIMSTLLAVDTRISYKDLSFKIVDKIVDSTGDEKRNTRGTYYGQNVNIEIKDTDKDTVAHEIGHYLDNKWGKELGLTSGDYASKVDQYSDKHLIKQGNSPIRLQWHKRFSEFVDGLSSRSDISSEYTQERKEVFARFVSKFVEWTAQKAGQPQFKEYSIRDDRFNQGDYQKFVKLLQEKSYVDIADGNPHDTTVSANAKKSKSTKPEKPLENKSDESTSSYWDANKGIGETPNQRNIDYLGFIVNMTPKQFRSLTPEGSMSNSGEKFANLVKNDGKTMAPPFLQADWDDVNNTWKVYDHEGRSRSDAAQILDPDKPIPVHIFPSKGMRAHHVTDEMLKAPFIPQDGGEPINIAEPNKKFMPRSDNFNKAINLLKTVGNGRENLDGEYEKLLYNSATADKNMQISREGLQPQHGDWVKEVLNGATDDPDLIDQIKNSKGGVYLSNRPDWVAAQVGRKLGKHVTDVTLEDIKNHGQLSITKFDENSPVYRIIDEGGTNGEYTEVEDVRGEQMKFYQSQLYDSDKLREPPFGAERGDWFTTEEVVPDVTLTGTDLIDYLKYYEKKYDSVDDPIRNHFSDLLPKT